MALILTVISGLVTLAIAYLIYRLVVIHLHARKLFAFGVPEGYSWWAGHLKVHPGPGEEGLEWMQQQTQRFSRGYFLQYGPLRAILVVNHPDSIKAILKTSEPKDPLLYDTMIKPWLGDGLLVSRGGRWARNRRLLTPAFHFDILKPYMDVNNRSADRLCDHLLQCLRRQEDKDDGGTSVEIYNPVSCSTLDVILRCAFSMQDNELQDKGSEHPYVAAVNKAAKMTVQRLFKPLHHSSSIYFRTAAGKEYQKTLDYLHCVTEDVIKRRRKDLEADPDLLKHKKRLDFLDILLTARDPDGAGLSDAEIRDEADTFLFEGHDTTASAISWILKEIANHPEPQAKCQKEVDSLLEGRADHDISWSDLNRLPYTSMCIKEAMRLNSPVPTIGRKTTKDMEIDGKTVPEGTEIEIQLVQLHLNPVVWGDNCKEFRPERMSSEELQKKDPYAFCPFSAGPRNCIGQNFAMNEIKVSVAKVLRLFYLSPDPSRLPSRMPELVMRPKSGLFLKLKSRTH